ncbi:MAG TPA: hypothetical protein PKJ95_05375, partial [Atribacterota bacterium]|nr:hypothetical protein [Atribacterota bacterium]
IEGFLKGFVSSLLAFFSLSKTYQYFIGQVKEIIPFMPIMAGNEFIIRVGIIVLLLGTSIGIFGSMLSLRKISFEEL